jgi:CRISPR-associated protein Cas1
MKHKALNTTCIEDLRGIEGKAANIYFSVFNELVLTQKDVFIFTERNRRPPRDEINAMLSFVYTLITNDMVSALETVGLDPYLGFMHTIRPGRPSLALDLIEEFRGYLGDRLVLSLINRRQVKRNDFIKQGDTVLMTDDCKKTIISAWQKRKKDTIEHPYLKEKIPVGLLPYSQAMLLARYVRQDLNNYPVFLIL